MFNYKVSLIQLRISYFETKYGNPSSKTHAYGWEAEAAIELAKKPEKKPSYRYASDPLSLIQREEKLIKQKCPQNTLLSCHWQYNNFEDTVCCLLHTC